jgi:arylsulfatase A-like enzyme
MAVTQRNLLIILTHGLRNDALSDEHCWPLSTPHFEALARRGLRMTSISACPTDPGGMVSLLTGVHPRQHGFVRDGDAESITNCLPAWLADQGYHVAGVGAVGPIRTLCHRSVITDDVSVMRPIQCDYWRAARAKGLAAAVMQQRKQRLRSGPFEPDRLTLEPEEDIDGFIAAEAVHMIERLPTDQPWALFVIFSGPANDLPPPPLYDGIVDPAMLCDGFVPPDFRTLDALAEPVYPRIMLQRLEPKLIGRIRADYLGRVSLIDYALRRIVDASDQRDDRTRTWTLVTSDRGHLLGEHGLLGHRSFLAGAVEVPLIIAPPRGAAMPDDAIPTGLFSTVDIAPTIAALGSCDIPSTLAGRSLLPLLHGNAVTPDLPGGCISEFNDRIMLENDRHKIIFHRATGKCLGLYDLVTDEAEKKNLADSPVGMNMIDAMRLRLADALLPLRAVNIK